MRDPTTAGTINVVDGINGEAYSANVPAILSNTGDNALRRTVPRSAFALLRMTRLQINAALYAAPVSSARCRWSRRFWLFVAESGRDFDGQSCGAAPRTRASGAPR